jgi:hypothetical protein
MERTMNTTKFGSKPLPPRGPVTEAEERNLRAANIRIAIMQEVQALRSEGLNADANRLEDFCAASSKADLLRFREILCGI